MEIVYERFVTLVQSQAHLVAVFEELQSDDKVDTILGAFPNVHMALVTQMYLDFLFHGKGRGWGQKLKERELLDIPYLKTQLLKEENVQRFSLNQLAGLVSDGLVTFRELLTSVVVDHLVTTNMDWTDSLTKDLLCWCIAEAYPRGQSADTVLCEQLTRSLMYSLSQSEHCVNVLGGVKGQVCQTSLDDLCTQLLVNKLTEQFHDSYESVVSGQEKWRFCASPESSKQYFAMASDSLRLVSVLRSTLAYHTEVHWGNLLMFTATLVNCAPQALQPFKDCVSEMLRNSLGGQLEGMFHYSLLMARQAALEGVFSYSQWFKDVYQSCGKHQIQFLFKWLTKLVPWEPPYALKAHLCLTSVGTGAKKAIVEDYTDLVRGRLSELNERVDNMCGMPEMQAVARDVDTALAKFTQTGKLDYLKKIRFIKKPFYEERLVPYLLSLAGKGRVEGLIQALERERMIPDKYLTALSGPEATCGQDQDSTVGLIDELIHITSCAQLSQLSAKLSTSATLTTNHVKFIDALLDRVCKAVTENGSPSLLTLSWLTSVLTMLSRQVPYCKALAMRMQELVCEKVGQLTEVQLTGLGTVCAFLWINDSPLTSPIGIAEALRDVAEGLMSLLPVWSCDLAIAKATLHFASDCLQCIKSGCKNAPVVLQHKVMYLKCRLEYMSVTESYKVKISRLVYFSDWVNWEVQRGNGDYLSPQQRYLYTRQQVEWYLQEQCNRESMCVDTFLTLCQHSLTTQGLSVMLMLCVDLTTAWLPQAIMDAVSKLPNTVTLYHKIVNMLCMLPAHLLLGSNRISDCLRELKSLTCDLTLPLALMLHLSGEAVVECPLYSASLLVHAPNLGQLPHVLQAQADWIHSGGDHPMTCDPILMGVCLYCCHRNDFSRLRGRISHTNSSQREELCSVLMDCCVRTMTENYPDCSHLLELCKVLLELSPTSIVVFKAEPSSELIQTLRKRFPFPGPDSVTMYAVLLFQLLGALTEHKVLCMSQHCSAVTPLVLASHKTLLDSCEIDLPELLGQATDIAKTLIRSSKPLKAYTFHHSLKPWL